MNIGSGVGGQFGAHLHRFVGNADAEFADTFNQLRDKRDKARYAHEEVILDEAIADKYLKVTRGLIDATYGKVRKDWYSDA